MPVSVWFFGGSAAFLAAGFIVAVAFRRATRPHRGWRIFGHVCVGMPVVGAALSGLVMPGSAPHWDCVAVGSAGGLLYCWADGFRPQRSD